MKYLIFIVVSLVCIAAYGRTVDHTIGFASDTVSKNHNCRISFMKNDITINCFTKEKNRIIAECIYSLDEPDNLILAALQIRNGGTLAYSWNKDLECESITIMP
jgi:hypothetical protein